MKHDNIQRPWLDENAKPLVQIENITKKFGDFTAVENVSLDIYEGELFCLLGGSGSGKSTLLRMMAGFEKPTEGRILIDGQDMQGVPPHKRPTNMMFQSYALFPHMNVLKNVMYGLVHGGASKSEAEEKAMNMLKMVRLENFVKRKPSQLSGGQRQRVALARALVKEPKLLLLDEPLGALDKKLREATQFELINIQERLGVTFIVVTHDQEEAMTLASRIGVMRDGVIDQIGEPRDIYEFPNSRFVAEFIGDVNMFEAQLNKNGEPSLAHNDEIGEIQIGQKISFGKGDDILIAVRPEKLEIGKKRSAKMTNAIEGQVEDIGYLGSESVFHVRLPSGKIVKAFRANRSRAASDDITWEDKVWVGWDDRSGVVLPR